MDSEIKQLRQQKITTVMLIGLFEPLIHNSVPGFDL
jgi:hypothetical protein